MHPLGFICLTSCKGDAEMLPIGSRDGDASAATMRAIPSSARGGEAQRHQPLDRSEEHTSELQSLMRISYAVFCLKKKKNESNNRRHTKNQKTQSNKRNQQH